MRREFPASLYIQYVPRCSRSLAALISAMKRGVPCQPLYTVRTALQPLASGADLGDEAGVPCQPQYSTYRAAAARLAALISAIRREFPASLYTVRTALQPLAGGADLGNKAGVPCQPQYSTYRAAAARWRR